MEKRTGQGENLMDGLKAEMKKGYHLFGNMGESGIQVLALCKGSFVALGEGPTVTGALESVFHDLRGDIEQAVNVAEQSFPDSKLFGLLTKAVSFGSEFKAHVSKKGKVVVEITDKDQMHPRRADGDSLHQAISRLFSPAPLPYSADVFNAA